MGTAILVAATVMQAQGAAEQQSAQNKSLEYNAGLLETNAKTRELQAINTGKIGGIQKSELKSQVGFNQASQRAAFGASGVVVDEGSAFDVVQATEIQGSLDAMTLQYNIEQEQFGYTAEADNLKSQASGLRKQKRSTSSAFTQSLLGTGLQVGAAFAGSGRG